MPARPIAWDLRVDVMERTKPRARWKIWLSGCIEIANSGVGPGLPPVFEVTQRRRSGRTPSKTQDHALHRSGVATDVRHPTFEGRRFSVIQGGQLEGE